MTSDRFHAYSLETHLHLGQEVSPKKVMIRDTSKAYINERVVARAFPSQIRVDVVINYGVLDLEITELPTLG